MPFEPDLKDKIEAYLKAHLPDDEWYEEKFEFVKDSTLALRLAEEFRSIRYIYKLLEGMGVENELLKAQIRVQIQSYASIYEAIIHHILFDLLPTNSEVQKLTRYSKLIQISIPNNIKGTIEKLLVHDDKKIVPTYQGVGRNDKTKVRFDAKAKCAFKLGAIDENMKDKLIEIYEARNAIHIHAEIRKNLDYQLDLSRTAYRRIKPFCEQVSRFIGDQNL